MKNLFYIPILTASLLSFTMNCNNTVYADSLDYDMVSQKYVSRFDTDPLDINEDNYTAIVHNYSMFNVPSVVYESGVLSFKAEVDWINPGFHIIRKATLIGFSRGNVKVFDEMTQVTSTLVDLTANLSKEELEKFATFTVTASYYDTLWFENRIARANIGLLKE
ncbi:hypothetical protein [Enterococcus sp. OL5]|uniref:hypothetical protein n=1 Tax=Enterococcus sp. OL5 TaxID=2590214 RepID=UPI0011263FAD|nr:hypothetical protein [Enterococcus sp. OL5]TPR56924.1 hypothetical protein FJU10_11170 [Enterococcus sp. OL5]